MHAQAREGLCRPTKSVWACDMSAGSKWHHLLCESGGCYCGAQHIFLWQCRVLGEDKLDPKASGICSYTINLPALSERRRRSARLPHTFGNACARRGRLVQCYAAALRRRSRACWASSPVICSTLSRDFAEALLRLTRCFLSSSRPATYSVIAWFASPSRAGASMATETASSVSMMLQACRKSMPAFYAGHAWECTLPQSNQTRLHQTKGHTKHLCSWLGADSQAAAIICFLQVLWKRVHGGWRG